MKYLRVGASQNENGIMELLNNGMMGLLNSGIIGLLNTGMMELTAAEEL